MNITTQLNNFIFKYGKRTKLCKADETTTTRISKEVFTERVLPIHKDESWPADLVDKLSLSKKKITFYIQS